MAKNPWDSFSTAVEPEPAPADSGPLGMDLDTIIRLENTAGYAKRNNIPIHKVVSHAGAIGEMQIMPGTARQYGFDPEKLYDPEYNRKVGQVILDDLNRRYKNDREAVAIAYNGGPGRANRWLRYGRDDSVLPKETQGYVSRLRGMPAAAPVSWDSFSDPVPEKDLAGEGMTEPGPERTWGQAASDWLDAAGSVLYNLPSDIGQGVVRGVESLDKTYGALAHDDFQERVARGDYAPLRPNQLDEPAKWSDPSDIYARKGIVGLASAAPTLLGALGLGMAAPEAVAGSVMLPLASKIPQVAGVLGNALGFGAGSMAQSYGDFAANDPETAARRTMIEGGLGAAQGALFGFPSSGGFLTRLAKQIPMQTAGVMGMDPARRLLNDDPARTWEEFYDVAPMEAMMGTAFGALGALHPKPVLRPPPDMTPPATPKPKARPEYDDSYEPPQGAGPFTEEGSFPLDEAIEAVKKRYPNGSKRPFNPDDYTRDGTLREEAPGSGMFGEAESFLDQFGYPTDQGFRPQRTPRSPIDGYIEPEPIYNGDVPEFEPFQEFDPEYDPIQRGEGTPGPYEPPPDYDDPETVVPERGGWQGPPRAPYAAPGFDAPSYPGIEPEYDEILRGQSSEPYDPPPNRDDPDYVDMPIQTMDEGTKFWSDARKSSPLEPAAGYDPDLPEGASFRAPGVEPYSPPDRQTSIPLEPKGGLENPWDMFSRAVDDDGTPPDERGGGSGGSSPTPPTNPPPPSGGAAAPRAAAPARVAPAAAAKIQDIERRLNAYEEDGLSSQDMEDLAEHYQTERERYIQAAKGATTDSEAERLHRIADDFHFKAQNLQEEAERRVESGLTDSIVNDDTVRDVLSRTVAKNYAETFLRERATAKNDPVDLVPVDTHWQDEVASDTDEPLNDAIDKALFQAAKKDLPAIVQKLKTQGPRSLDWFEDKAYGDYWGQQRAELANIKKRTKEQNKRLKEIDAEIAKATYPRDEAPPDYTGPNQVLWRMGERPRLRDEVRKAREERFEKFDRRRSEAARAGEQLKLNDADAQAIFENAFAYDWENLPPGDADRVTVGEALAVRDFLQAKLKRLGEPKNPDGWDSNDIRRSLKQDLERVERFFADVDVGRLRKDVTWGEYRNRFEDLNSEKEALQYQEKEASRRMREYLNPPSYTQRAKPKGPEKEAEVKRLKSVADDRIAPARARTAVAQDYFDELYEGYSPDKGTLDRLKAALPAFEAAAKEERAVFEEWYANTRDHQGTEYSEQLHRDELTRRGLERELQADRADMAVERVRNRIAKLSNKPEVAADKAASKSKAPEAAAEPEQLKALRADLEDAKTEVEYAEGALEDAMEELEYRDAWAMKPGKKRDALVNKIEKQLNPYRKAVQDARDQVQRITDKILIAKGEKPLEVQKDEVKALPAEIAKVEQTRDPIAGWGPSKRAEAKTPSDIRVPVMYTTVSLDDLIASHSVDGAENPIYPQALQPRDRGNRNTALQIRNIIAKWNPPELLESPLAGTGAPIIDEFGIVEAGNGRVMALREVRANHPELWQKYQDALRQAGYGTSSRPDQVLVRVRTNKMSPADRAAFARDSNGAITAEMTAAEKVRADARSLSDEVFKSYVPGPLSSAANRPFVTSVLRAITTSPAELATMVREDGLLNDTGMQRVRQAMLGKAYPEDKALIEAMVESKDDIEVKGVAGALMDVAPQWAAMRADARMGRIPADLDATKPLLDAVSKLVRARREGQPITKILNDNDLFSGLVDDRTKIWASYLFNDTNLTKPKAQGRLKNDLEFYTEEARKQTIDPNQGDLIGGGRQNEDQLKILAKRLGVEPAVVGAGQKDSGSQSDLFRQEPSVSRAGGEDGAPIEPAESGQGTAQAEPATEEPRVVGNPRRGSSWEFLDDKDWPNIGPLTLELKNGTEATFTKPHRFMRSGDFGLAMYVDMRQKVETYVVVDMRNGDMTEAIEGSGNAMRAVTEWEQENPNWQPAPRQETSPEAQEIADELRDVTQRKNDRALTMNELKKVIEQRTKDLQSETDFNQRESLKATIADYKKRLTAAKKQFVDFLERERELKDQLDAVNSADADDPRDADAIESQLADLEQAMKAELDPKRRNELKREFDNLMLVLADLRKGEDDFFGDAEPADKPSEPIDFQDIRDLLEEKQESLVALQKKVDEMNGLIQRNTEKMGKTRSEKNRAEFERILAIQNRQRDEYIDDLKVVTEQHDRLKELLNSPKSDATLAAVKLETGKRVAKTLSLIDTLKTQIANVQQNMRFSKSAKDRARMEGTTEKLNGELAKVEAELDQELTTYVRNGGSADDFGPDKFIPDAPWPLDEMGHEQIRLRKRLNFLNDAIFRHDKEIDAIQRRQAELKKNTKEWKSLEKEREANALSRAERRSELDRINIRMREIDLARRNTLPEPPEGSQFQVGKEFKKSEEERARLREYWRQKAREKYEKEKAARASAPPKEDTRVYKKSLEERLAEREAYRRRKQGLAPARAARVPNDGIDRSRYRLTEEERAREREAWNNRKKDDVRLNRPPEKVAYGRWANRPKPVITRLSPEEQAVFRQTLRKRAADLTPEQAAVRRKYQQIARELKKTGETQKPRYEPKTRDNAAARRKDYQHFTQWRGPVVSEAIKALEELPRNVSGLVGKWKRTVLPEGARKARKRQYWVNEAGEEFLREEHVAGYLESPDSQYRLEELQVFTKRGSGSATTINRDAPWKVQNAYRVTDASGRNVSRQLFRDSRNAERFIREISSGRQRLVPEEQLNLKSWASQDVRLEGPEGYRFDQQPERGVDYSILPESDGTGNYGPENKAEFMRMYEDFYASLNSDPNWRQRFKPPTLPEFERLVKQIREEFNRIAPAGYTLRPGEGWINGANKLVMGFHDPRWKIIAFSVNVPDPYGTFRHEVFHAVWDRLSEPEKRAIYKAALADGSKPINQWDIHKRYGHLNLDLRVQEFGAEEFMAYRRDAKEVAKGGPDIVKPSKLPPILQKAFDRISKAFDRLGNYVRDLFGVRDSDVELTAEDVYQLIESGIVGKRPLVTDPKKPTDNEILRSMGPRVVDDVNDTLKGLGLPLLRSYPVSPQVQLQVGPAVQAAAGWGSYGSLREKLHWYDLSRMGKADYWRIKTQDKELRIRRIDEMIERARGFMLATDEDASLAATTYHSIVGNKLREFDKRIVKDLVNVVAKQGLTLDQLNDYIQARAAPDRNKRMAEINPPKFDKDGKMIHPGMPDGGSGMTNKEAAEIIEKERKAGNIDKLNKAAKVLYEVQDDTRQILLESGLVPKEILDHWDATEPFHVPFRGFSRAKDVFGEDPEHVRAGSGFDVRGSGLKRALGRAGNRAGDSISYILAEHEQAIIRGEKNKVGITLGQMIANNRDLLGLQEVEAGDGAVRLVPKVDPKTGAVADVVFELDALPIKRTLVTKYRDATDPVTGKAVKMPYQEVAWRHDPLDRMRDEDTIGFTKDGKVHYIKIHDALMARAMKNLSAAHMNEFLKVVTSLQTFLGRMFTQYNPTFSIPNLIRDSLTAPINMLGMKDVPREVVMGTIARVPSALIEGYRAIRYGKRDTPMQRYAHEMVEHGGRVEFFGLENVEERGKRLQNEMKMADPGAINGARRLARKFTDFISDLNSAIENATRLAAYSAMRDAGKNPKESARVALEATVNFYRKGEWSPYINAAYLFANANIQGNVALLRSLHKSPAARKIVLGGIVLGIMVDQINSVLSPTGETGEKKWDSEITDWTKDHNITITNPNPDSNIAALKFPLPYGYNIFPAMGQRISQMMREVPGKTPFTVAMTTVASTLDSFLPIGQGSQTFESVPGFVRAASPTLLQPWVDVAVNMDFTGRPIQKPKTEYNQPIPESERGFNNVGPVAKWVTKELNRLTGGSELRSGWMDTSPAMIDHVFGFYTGGLGRFIQQATQLPFRYGDDSFIEPRNWPIVNRFIEGQNQWYLNQKFFAVRDALEITKDELNSLRINPDPALRDRLVKDYMPEVKSLAVFAAAERAMAPLYKARAAVMLSDRPDKKELKEQIEERIRLIQTRALAYYNGQLTEK